MKWFKFYGQDWLTDRKIRKLSMEDRLCFIALLCIASSEEKKGGVIPHCTEEEVIELAHTNPVTSKGFLERLNDNKMITRDNNSSVIIVNFSKRQGSNLSGYERVKKFRESKSKANIQAKSKNKIVIIDNADDNADDNARIDKNRIDKNNTNTSKKVKKKKVTELPVITFEAQHVQVKPGNSPGELQGTQWNELIDSFKTVNPFYLDFYKNTSERKALQALVDSIGFQKTLGLIKNLDDLNSRQFYPKSTKPTELKRNLPTLNARFREEKNKGSNKSAPVQVINFNKKK